MSYVTDFARHITGALVGDVVTVMGEDEDELPGVRDLEDFGFWDDSEIDPTDKDRWWSDPGFTLPGFEENQQQVSENPELAKLANYTTETYNATGWMEQFENGRIPEKALVAIGDGHFLRPDAAASWKQMRRAAAKDGVTLAPNPGAGHAYRDYETQVRLAQEKGLYSQGGLAAEPGTSDHGWGVAVDADLASRQWLANNGAKYGWKTIPKEPWHWEFEGNGEIQVRTKNKPKKGVDRPQRDPEAQVAEAVAGRSSYSNFTALPFGAIALLAKDSVRRQRDPKVDTKGYLPYVPAKWKRTVQQAAKRYGVSARLLAAIGMVESGWSDDVTLTSSAGAVGPLQVMPAYWEGKTGHDLHTYRGNIFSGAFIMARNLKATGGDVRAALSMYYSGSPDSGAGAWYAGKVLGLL